MFSGRTLAGAAVAAVIVVAGGCGAGPDAARTTAHVPTHGSSDLKALAKRFAPLLRLHADEPSAVAAVVAVFHPERALIGYHVLFTLDVVRHRGGERLDHEVVWVTYDAVTLKVVDVATYWHRTVLRTLACVADAQRSSQRPTIDVQWGQHGMLPLGWEALRTTRPHLELHAYYNMVRHSDTTVFPDHESVFEFSGSYEDYVRFTELVDLARFIDANSVAVAANPETAMAGRVDRSFAEKKHWPDQ